MPHPARLSPTPCVAVTVDLEDFHTLACRGLAIPLAARRALTDLEVEGPLAYRITPGATRDAVNAELRILLHGVLAEILGERGLYVDVDVDAGAGEVFMTPLGCIPQRAATIRIAPIDERAVA
jgi:hypothetical protein